MAKQATFTPRTVTEQSAPEGPKTDPLLAVAAALVTKHEGAFSIGMLQRAFKVGVRRSMRLIAELEAAGVATKRLTSSEAMRLARQGKPNTNKSRVGTRAKTNVKADGKETRVSNVHLSCTLWDRIHAEAKDRGITGSRLIARAVVLYLEGL